MKAVARPDEIAENPREWALGTMVCWHRRYDLGEEHSFNSDNFIVELAMEHDDEFENYVCFLENDCIIRMEDMGVEFERAQYLVNEKILKLADKIVSENYVVLNVYMYEHSGVALNTNGFGCMWDSGQVGYIYCPKGKEGLSDEEIEKCLEKEVEVYSAYISGDIWWVEIIDDNGEEVDCCGGFYGLDDCEHFLQEYGLTEEDLSCEMR
jgi:hypothetical protein